MKRIPPLIVPIFSLIILTGSLAQTAPVQVVATTTLIADVAHNVGGDLAEVVALIPPDSDTHAFQPTPQDAVVIAQAEVMLVNGGNLEEGLLDLVATAATVPITTVSDGVALRSFGEHADDAEGCAVDEHDHDDDHDADEADHDHDDDHDADGDDHDHDDDHDADEADHDHDDDHDAEADDHDHDDDHDADGDDHDHEHDHGGCDPHVWGDPGNVAVWAENIAEALAAVDPTNADLYRANAAAYQDELAALDADLEALFAPLPDSRRVLVTNHDFLSYFAARYDFAVIGTILPATSTLAEPAPQDVATLIELIKEYGVPAIFAEVSDTDALATTIAAETGDVQVVSLYSGSLSAADGPAGTYLDYMRTNAQAIADALAETTAS